MASVGGLQTRNYGHDNNLISPTNASGTSISALTVDDSLFNFVDSNNNIGSLIVSNDKMSTNIDYRLTEIEQNHQQDQNITKGTLFGRIMQQLNQQSYNQDDKKKICAPRFHYSNTNKIYDNLINKRPAPINVSIEGDTSIEHDNKTHEPSCSPAHEVSLSSCDTSFDEWREVEDKISARIYYYNRRTRQSTWILPVNAVVTRRRDKNSSLNQTVPSCKDIQAHGDQNLHSARFFNPKHSAEEVNHLMDHQMNVKIESSLVKNVNDEQSSNTDSWRMKTVFCMFCGEKVFLCTFQNHINICEERIKSNPQISGIIEKSLKDSVVPAGSPDQRKSEATETELNIGNRKMCDIQNIQPELSDSSGYDNSDDLKMSYREKSIPYSNRIRIRRKNQTVDSQSGTIQNADDNNYDVVLSSLFCSCPFCRRSFSTGNKLSRHLLCCRERRNSGRKRRSLLARHDNVNSSSITDDNVNLQTTLITDGGRSLPGYPKLARSPVLIRSGN